MIFISKTKAKISVLLFVLLFLSLSAYADFINGGFENPACPDGTNGTTCGWSYTGSTNCFVTVPKDYYFGSLQSAIIKGESLNTFCEICQQVSANTNQALIFSSSAPNSSANRMISYGTQYAAQIEYGTNINFSNSCVNIPADGTFWYCFKTKLNTEWRIDNIQIIGGSCNATNLSGVPVSIHSTNLTNNSIINLTGNFNFSAEFWNGTYNNYNVTFYSNLNGTENVACAYTGLSDRINKTCAIDLSNYSGLFSIRIYAKDILGNVSNTYYLSKNNTFFCLNNSIWLCKPGQDGCTINNIQQICPSFQQCIAGNGTPYCTNFTINYTTLPDTPIIYTLDSDKYEKVFVSGDTVKINVVIKNPLPVYAAVNTSFYITDETGMHVYSVNNGDQTVYLPPNSYNYTTYTWNTGDYAEYTSSGFHFTGKKFYATLSTNNTEYRQGFYVDEYDVPDWLRNNVELHLGDEFRDEIDKSENKEDILNYYENMMEYAQEKGFTSMLFHNYWSYGYTESHQSSSVASPINYWFPASESEDSYYSTPYPHFIRVAGSQEKARLLIKDLVETAQDKQLKVVAYIDPMAIYDPETYVYQLDLTKALSSGYPAAIKHHNSTTAGYAALDENGNPKRANFLEDTYVTSDMGLPFSGVPGYSILFSNIKDFAYQVSACGPGKEGDANDESAFSSGEISSDLSSNWTNDPSHHYETVKEVSWLIQNYGFDGISTDDTGRLIMKSGPASYCEDFWTCSMGPAKPMQSLYGVSEDDYCSDLRGSQDKDQFEMDAFANMINHMRDQIKNSNGGDDKYLISNDYFVPSDVGWKSISSSEDMSASDQFNIINPSFARWAYKTFDQSYKVLRTDLRRSTTVPLSIPFIPENNRPHMVRGVLLAAAWANQAHPEIILGELKKDKEGRTEALLSNYLDMRRTVSLPIYDELAQQLVYHSELNDPVTYQKNSEVEFPVESNGEKPYAVLYRIPNEYGEKARILHIINTRVLNGFYPDQWVPKDITAKIKIPKGEEVNKVYLISPDYDSNQYPDYTRDITLLNPDIWSVEGEHIHLTLNPVVTYSIVYIEFKPSSNSGSSFVSSGRFGSGGVIESVVNAVMDPVLLGEYVSGSLLVKSQDNYLTVSLGYPSSDLDLHLVSPSGKHIGLNYSINSTDAVSNSSYIVQNTTESIYLFDPEPGNWTYKVYGKNVSQQYSELGEPFNLSIFLSGNYTPNVTISLVSLNSTLNQTLSVPVSIKNQGEGGAYNVSIMLLSESINFSQNISLGDLKAGEGVDTEFSIIPTVTGNVSLEISVNYSDVNGTLYNFTNSTIIEVFTNPILFVYQAYPSEISVENQSMEFNITVTNYGSSDAFNVNITVNLTLSNVTQNFTIPRINVSESVNMSYNFTPIEGRQSSTVFVSYVNGLGEQFFTGTKSELDVKGITCVKGDLNCDGTINSNDFQDFEEIYKSTCDNSTYSLRADFDENCLIDFKDFAELARRYQE